MTSPTEPDTAPAEIPLAIRIQAAKAWTPDKDRTEAEILDGHLVAVVRRESEYGAYPCVIVDTGAPGGALTAFHAFHTVAKDQLTELRPSAGERITIVAHPRTETRKRKDSEGNPVKYSPYSIYNPDNIAAVTSNWNWDDAENDTPGF